MRKFQYPEYTEDGHKIITITEEEILNEYWRYWRDKIYTIDTANTLKIRELSINEQKDRCIDDFIVTNWAIEVKDG